jgi:hypothetical protein
MDAFQQCRSWFVGGVLGDELAAEGFGEERGRELGHLRLRRVKPRLDLVGQRKQRFHPAQDSLLFGFGRHLTHSSNVDLELPSQFTYLASDLAQTAFPRHCRTLNFSQSRAHKRWEYRPHLVGRRIS